MAVVFFVMCGMAIIWSGIRSEIIRWQLTDTFPPQFQDGLAARYAFHVYALRSSTPLPLQAEYMKSLWGSCVAVLSAALGFFSASKIPLGCIVLAVFFWSVFSARKSWKTYKENCNRAETQYDEEQP